MSIYVTPNPLPAFVGGNRALPPRGTAPLVVVPTFVQGAVADTGSTEPASLDVVLSSAATAGNLIVVAGNSDATLTGFSGSSVAASAINAQGCYLFYKVAAGGETTLTITPSVARPIALVAAEYSGVVTSSPADQTVTATGAGSTTTGPVSAGTTGTTVQASELVLAVTGPHGYPNTNLASSPVWSGGYTSRGQAASAFGTNSRNSAVFLGELVVSAVGTQTTSTTWTNGASDWGAIIATFKGA